MNIYRIEFSIWNGPIWAEELVRAGDSQEAIQKLKYFYEKKGKEVDEIFDYVVYDGYID